MIADRKILFKSRFKNLDEMILNEVHSEFLLNMFEGYKEANKKIIENLLDENSVYFILIKRFKSELQFGRLLLEMIKKRLDEVLFSSGQNIEKNNVAASGDIRRGSLYSRKKESEKSINSIKEKKISVENFRLSTLNLDNFDYDLTEDYIIYQMNYLRSEIKSNKSKLKIKDKMIEKMKMPIKDSKRHTFISKGNTSGVLDNCFDKNTYALTMSIPRWVPDNIVKNCLNCSKQFGFFTRKHHCRMCGNIFCSSCCNNFANFFPYYTGPVRSCEDCYNNKEKELIHQY